MEQWNVVHTPTRNLATCIIRREEVDTLPHVNDNLTTAFETIRVTKETTLMDPDRAKTITIIKGISRKMMVKTSIRIPISQATNSHLVRGSEMPTVNILP